MLSSFIMLTIGFAVLLLGAHWLVKGASSLAKRLDVPEIVIGLTVVAFGTSTPEMVVNILSAIRGAADLSFGNVIGSNNFNILIILGISALIYPLDVKRATTWREIPFAALTSCVLLFLVNDQWFDSRAVNLLNRGDGFILLGFFVIFLIYSHNLARQGSETESQTRILPRGVIAGLITAGFAGLILGGSLVVRHAVSLAEALGISQKVIGLTIVAAGTSMPELATSAMAAYRKKPDIAVGNIVGSNIFNLLFIMGITSIIRQPAYNPAFNPDQYLMIGAILLLFLMMFNPKRHRLDRWEGAVFVLMYVLYAVFLLR